MAEIGRNKALETTLATLQQRYGEGVIMKLGQAALSRHRNDTGWASLRPLS